MTTHETSLKASELRIGNYVTIDNHSAWPELKGIPLEVVGCRTSIDGMFPNSTGEVNVQDAKSYEYFQFDEFIKPIPLTEEWLLKFGFVKNDYSVNGVQYTEPFFHINLEAKGWLVRWIDTLSTWALHPKVSDYNVVPVRFVHELQNLYFALTGEELIIKDK